MTADRGYYGVSLSFETILKAQTVYEKWQSNNFKTNWIENWGQEEEEKCFLLPSEFVIDFKRVNGTLALEECQSLDLKNLPFIVHL